MIAYDCDRLGRLYQVQWRYGPVEWQDHGGPHSDFTAALEQAIRVSRRARSERPDLYVHAEPDFQPDSYAYREARLPEVDYYGPSDMRMLSARIRRGRRRVGWR